MKKNQKTVSGIAAKMLTVLIVLNTFFTSAQTLKQVIVLTEGQFGGPVTVGSYDPVAKTYQNFDTITARFGNDVLVDGGFIFVAADDKLVKYDLTTKSVLQTQTVTGIRRIAVWNNQLLVTRGESFVLNSFFQVYDKNNLSFLYELTGLSDDSEGIKVVGDTAYVGVNGFGVTGKLAVIDLNAQTLNREIDLGADGLNPENVQVGKNGKIFTVNNLDWSDASVTQYDVQSTAFQSIRLGRSTGCSASALHLNNVYFQTSGERQLGVFTNGLGVWDSLNIDKSIYGLAIDEINAHIYVGETDYTTYGKVFIYDFYATIIDSFPVDISPKNFAFDLDYSSGVNEKNNLEENISIYPNPASAMLNIDLKKVKAEKISVSNLLGEVVCLVENNFDNFLQIDTKDFQQGIYFMTIKTANGIITEKISVVR